LDIFKNLQTWVQRLTTESAAGSKLDPNQRKELLAALASDRAADRWLAAEALAEGDPGKEGVAALAGLLGDPDLLLRSEAARSLGQIGGRAARQALLDAVQAGNTAVQAAAADGLGALPATAETITALAGLLESRDSEVRQSAAEALARLDPPAAARDGSSPAPAIQAALLQVLSDGEAAMVRRGAALALARWGDTSVDSALAARRDDESEDRRVREAAALALSRPRRLAPSPEPAVAERSAEETPGEQTEPAQETAP
jgi:HEAT repeat protein